MQEYTEKLDGGLNTANHAMMLEPGEAAYGANWYYKYNSDFVYRSPLKLKLGRTAVSGGSYQALTGLVAMQFDNGNKYAVACNGAVDKLYRAPITTIADGTTLTFTDITPASGFGGGTTMVSAQYGDKVYLFTGDGTRNTVMLDDGTTRQAGMNPVTVAPGLGLVTSTWPLTDDAAVPAYYEYWATECVIDSDGELVLESTATDTAYATIYVTDVAKGVDIARPQNSADTTSGKFNSNTTHWRVYRSISKEYSTDQAFPNGMLISPNIPIATGFFHDGAGSTLGFTAATTLVSSANVTNPSNLVGAGSATFNGLSACALRTFGLGAATDPVTGIEIKVTFPSAFNNTGIALFALLSFDAGVTYPVKKQIGANRTTTVTVGAPDDTWGFNINSAGLSDSLFWVQILQTTGAASTVIDKVEAKVTYASSYATSAEPFPAIYLTAGGTGVVQGEDGLPPVAKCGVVYNGSLLTNDIANIGRLRWSVPGKPESFPESYYADLDTPYNDGITSMCCIGNRVVVGTQGAIWRMNYLPTEDDIRFQRGPAVDLIDPNSGCVGPMAMVEFLGSGGRPEVAYLSPRGLMSTDGFVTRMLCTSFDWAFWFDNIYSSIGDLSVSTLLNNPANEELILSVPAAAIQLHFPYGKRHVKQDGTLKCSGQITVVESSGGVYGTTGPGCVFRDFTIATGESAVVLWGINGVASAAGTGYVGGVVWYTPFSTTKHGSANRWGTTELFSYKTRKMYLAGTTGEFRLKEVYVGPGSLGDITLTATPLNYNATATSVQKTLTAGAYDIRKAIFDMRAEGVQFTFTMSNLISTECELGFITLLGENFGKEDR